jgi:hypothetical protein
MKKHIHGKQLEEMLDSIHEASDRLLAIECEFNNFLRHHEYRCLLKDICSGKISKNAVIRETLKSIRTVTRYAERDALNIRKCAAFIRRKYPHAIFSGEDFSISVDNLTSPEIDDCLNQKDLKFTCYTGMNS